MKKKYCVYILASQPNGTLYVGVTSDLVRRIWEHRNTEENSFVQRYGVYSLVYFEIYDDAENAIHREKRLKKYTRAAKIKLIEQKNENWNDLYENIVS